MKSMIIDGFDVHFAKKMFENSPFDRCFYIGDVKTGEFSGDNFFTYNCFDIPLGNYPEDFNETEPLDEEVIMAYSSCEITVLKMFERNDFWFDSPYDKRNAWYLKHLRYWNSIIKNNNVQCFIKSNFPHEVYDYEIYSIMKKNNRKCYFFTQTSFLNRFYLETDPFDYNCFKEFLDSNTVHDCSDEVKKYLEDLRKPATYVKKPFYMSVVENRGVKKHQHAIIKNYDKKYAQQADFSNRYFYVALHYQPEMTTCPLAGCYVDQDLIIDALDYYLPDDVYIYVKEHPKQTIVGRNEDFYKKYQNSRRVKFIKTDVSSLDLVDNALAVVTCTGTVGFESLVRQKPVLMFGSYFYKYAPGCFFVKSNEQIKAAIIEILKGVRISLNDIEVFFVQFYNFSYYGYVDSFYKSQMNISEEENNHKLLEIIENRIFRNFRGNICLQIQQY